MKNATKTVSVSVGGEAQPTVNIIFALIYVEFLYLFNSIFFSNKHNSNLRKFVTEVSVDDQAT